VSQAIRRQPADLATEKNLTPRMIIAMALTLGLFAGAGYVGQSILRAASFPINKVNVEGDFRFLTPAYVQALVTPALQGGFFQVHVQRIRENLIDEPWIQDAQVERVWPDAISVTIQEQQPAARWGRSALLNVEADVFAPSPGSFPGELPKLSGPVGTEREVLTNFKAMQVRFARLGLDVERVALSERGAWTVQLTGPVRLVVGRHRVDERLDRFEAAFGPVLKDAWPRLESIDLRYTNGFAVLERGSGAATSEPGGTSE
jgi:cell division protein FtsQ